MGITLQILFFFIYIAWILIKLSTWKSWLLSEAERNDFSCPCLMNRANCAHPNRISLFWAVWFVCLHWTTAANIWYLQDSKQGAEVMFLTSDLQEKGGTLVKINKLLQTVSGKVKNPFFVVYEWYNAACITWLVLSVCSGNRNWLDLKINVSDFKYFCPSLFLFTNH